MKTVYSDKHLGHSGHNELNGGRILPSFELPSRAEYIVARVRERGLGEVLPPAEHDLETAAKFHSKDYLDFLPTVWERWLAEGNSGPALPSSWPAQGLRRDLLPTSITGLLGHYSIDASACFVEGTWPAVKAAHDCALTAAGIVAGGERAAFALCRPPGHHAGTNFMGGYCFINNAAVAAQSFLDGGAKRVAILDVDYHHGNGSQEIFYERSDVMVVNLHADPREEYPYFLGAAEERGAGAGLGFNLNFPMRLGTAWADWSAALEDGCQRIAAYDPDVVVVSLGVDTFEKDPISGFKLKTDDYPQIGRRIAALGKPTLFVMEGGYAVEEIAVNAVGVLEGFEGA
jgi:acetoin utilization deacetylase AcuC-like enzyme